MDAFFTFNRSYCTRGHTYKLFPVYTPIDVNKRFFSKRVVEPWNSLPAEPHHFLLLSAFKTFLKCRFVKVCGTVERNYNNDMLHLLREIVLFTVQQDIA